jgi:hypothetical protein
MPKTKNSRSSLVQVQRLGGKAAVFVRGMLLEIYDQDEKRLRKAQEAGLLAVRELGEEISVPYISKLSGILQDADVLVKQRVGRSFQVDLGDSFDELWVWIENNPDWGTAIEDLPDDEVIQERSQFLDQMNADGAVRINYDRPLGKAAYSLARDKFNLGEYDMIFVRSGWDVMAVNPDEQTEHEVTYISSVANQK